MSQVTENNYGAPPPDINQSVGEAPDAPLPPELSSDTGNTGDDRFSNQHLYAQNGQSHAFPHPPSAHQLNDQPLYPPGVSQQQHLMQPESANLLTGQHPNTHHLHAHGVPAHLTSPHHAPEQPPHMQPPHMQPPHMQPPHMQPPHMQPSPIYPTSSQPPSLPHSSMSPHSYQMQFHPPPGTMGHTHAASMYAAPQPSSSNQHPYPIPPQFPVSQVPQPPMSSQPSLWSQGSSSSYPIQQPSSFGTIPSQLLGSEQSYATFGAGSKVPPTEIKLEISAKGLRDRDFISKSDPVAVVFEEVKAFRGNHSVSDQQRWRQIGRTESIKDDLNPHFKQQVTVPYRFEELQNIRIGLWDIDSKNPALTHHDFLGDVRTTLGDIVASGKWTAALSYPRAADNKTLLGNTRKLGTVTVQVHENSKNDKIAVHLKLSALKLDKKDLFGKSDPYYVITQLKGRTGSRVHLRTSEVIQKNLNPSWLPTRLLVDVPKGGTKKDISLEIQVIDKDYRSRDDEIGLVVASLQELESLPRLTVVNSKNLARQKKKSAGTLVVDSCSSLVLPSFLQYLQGGLRLHFSVAIDMTASNGDPKNPASLHFMDPVMHTNQYVRALSAITEIIRVYTPPDQQFPAFGFGADIDSSGTASHCFPLNLSASCYCEGLRGIFEAYGKTLSTVSLSGPTNFTPIIETVMDLSDHREHSQKQQNYDVLLILTDGVVSDYVRTVDKIIDASQKCALSIIIIGVGNADFRKMEDLDCDDTLLASADNKRRAKRDIVQFVPFRDFENGPPDRLAAHVLAELPGNVIEYYTTLNPPVMPNPPLFLSQVP